MQQLSALRQEVAAMREEKRQQTALSAVRQAQAEGKVAADSTDNFKQALALAEANLEQFTALMASLPCGAVVPVQPVKRGSGASAQLGACSEMDRHYARQLGLTDEDLKDMGRAD